MWVGSYVEPWLMSRLSAMRTRILKSKPRIAPGPFLSKVHPSLERMSIFATAHRRRSHGTGPGTSVALVGWIRRAAFVGPVARA
jgi:hypothetical protein